MPNFPLAATAVASILLSFATGAIGQTVTPTGAVTQKASPGAGHKVPPDLPLAIICLNEQTHTWAVGYLNLIDEDGSATYVAGNVAVRVNAEGVVQPPSDRPAGGDCFGKTLKELRAAGRVVEFKRQ